MTTATRTFDGLIARAFRTGLGVAESYPPVVSMPDAFPQDGESGIIPDMNTETLNGQTYTIKIQGRLSGSIDLERAGRVDVTVPLNIHIDGVKSQISLPELSQLLQEIATRVQPTGLAFTYGPTITAIEKQAESHEL